MSVKKILTFPDAHLSCPSQFVSPASSSISALLDDLLDTLYHSPGVGLAAPQIGILKRVSVINTKRERSKKRVDQKEKKLIVLINPELICGEGVQIPREGCLSVPDWLANVKRHEYVKVKTDVLGGGEKIIEAHGFEALALQHEIDHLNGLLFLDRIADLKSDIFRRGT